MRTRLTRERGGFSLIELLVTIFIAGVVFSAMVPLFVDALQRNSDDTMRTISQTVAQDLIEKVRQLDYNDITQAHLEDPTFMTEPAVTGQPAPTPMFGTSVAYSTGGDASTTRYLTVTYDVDIVPATATSGSEQYKNVTVTVTWTGAPQPAYVTVKQTQIYKQYAGPQIIDYSVVSNGATVASLITANDATLRARINAADVSSMQTAVAVSEREEKWGYVEFTITNTQGTVIATKRVWEPSSTDNAVYEWALDTWVLQDGLYNFRAVGYSAQTATGGNYQGNMWQLTFQVEHGAPPPPVVTATPGNTTVTLSWVLLHPATDLVSYQVWRAPAEAGPYVKIYPPTGQNSLNTSYVNTGLTNGTTYWYKVYSVDSAGNSSPSSAVSATPEAPVGDTNPPTAPGSFTAVKGGPNTPTIKLTWTPSVDNPPPATPSGCDFYVIERASNSTFTAGLSFIATALPYGSPVQNTTITDTGAGYTSTWYYRMRCVDAQGNSSAWSTTASATTDGPVMRTIRVNNGNTAKHYVWVQNPVTGKYYTTGGVAGATATRYSVNKNGGVTFSNMPSAMYTVFWSLNPSGIPLKATSAADASAANATVNIP